MLTAHHLSKSFDSQSIFQDVTFSLSAGERSGLVGPNGCGKTTLLRILAGLEEPSSGTVRRDPALRIGYLPQGNSLDPTLTLGEMIQRLDGKDEALYQALEQAAAALALALDDPVLQTAYDVLLAQVEQVESGQAAQVLAGLGLAQIDPALSVCNLSGGQQTRLALAQVLLGQPQLLLLDEPTNHLDIAMLEWLEDWLSRFQGAVLIVSHDRAFLDHTIERILELDPQHERYGTGLHEYAGNYSDYLAQRQAEIEKQWDAYKDQQMEIKRMQQDIARVKAQAAHTERMASSIRIGGPEYKAKGFKSYQQGVAKKVARKAKARETRLERYVDSDERVERPQRAWQMKMAFGETPHLGRAVLRAEDLSVGYPPQPALLSGLNLEIRAGQRIVLSGPNGSGKTTLLRTLSGQLAPVSGSFYLGPSARLGVMSQDQSELDPGQNAVQALSEWFANETQARNFLSYYLLTGDEALKPAALLSYGQRARLVLARLVAAGCNLLLLDEPVNHLDIPSRAQFEQALAGFEGAVLAVVHDRYFIERFADEVWWVEDGGIRVLDGAPAEAATA